MFESDDFDQVLSQLDYPDVTTVKTKKKESINTANENEDTISFKTNILSDGSPNQTTTPGHSESEVTSLPCSNISVKSVILDKKHNIKCSEDIENASNSRVKDIEKDTNSESFLKPKHNKRKIINSYFDHQSKRKFPGPAGLLTGALEITKDDNICQMEVLSQDIDYTQHNVRRDLFESPMWTRLLSDVKSWKADIDSINSIKQQALSGNLRRRKAQNVTAFVEAVDRSAIDPLVILRDATGSIKCTLHRDAWSAFSQYILSDCCAVILQKPTVLTTGGAFKKHYLNITLSNILAIYSSTVLSDDGNKTLPDGYSFVYEDEFTVIKTEKCSDSLGTSLEHSSGAEELLIDGLDSFFSDDLF